MGSYPVQAWISFRPYFHYCSSSIHYCKDHFHSSMYIVGKTHLFVDATSWCTCLYIISWENYWESQIVSHNLTSYQILPLPSPIPDILWTKSINVIVKDNANNDFNLEQLPWFMLLSFPVRGVRSIIFHEKKEAEQFWYLWSNNIELTEGYYF